MGQVEITAVDERDSSWEDPTPRFRVYLQGGACVGGVERTGGSTWTYDVTGADLLQVVDWAQRQVDETSTYSVALVVDDAEAERRNPGGGRGLVWLVGIDGNDTSDDDTTTNAQRRMLQRRREPAVVGAGDQIPDVDPGLNARAGALRPREDRDLE